MSRCSSPESPITLLAAFRRVVSAGVGDDPPFPNCLYEIVFTDDPMAILDQVTEQVETCGEVGTSSDPRCSSRRQCRMRTPRRDSASCHFLGWPPTVQRLRYILDDQMSKAMSLVGTKRQFAQCKTTSGVGVKPTSRLNARTFSVWTQRRHSSSAPPALIGLLLAVSTPRCFASSLAVLWTHSMKSFAAGLHVRFLRVTIATGRRLTGILIGRTLRDSSLLPKPVPRLKDRHKLCARDQPEA